MADRPATDLPEDLAATTYRMALALWKATKNREPKMGDTEFFGLVSTCSLALQGRATTALPEPATRSWA